MTAGPVGVGIIGAGMISTTYLENMTRMPDLRVLAIGDIDTARARAQADPFGVSVGGSADDVLAVPDVEIVINLTIPAVHAAVSQQILRAGKHVWTEKPLSIDLPSARDTVELARETGLRVGVAPDTMLGPGVQVARRLIAEGAIGRPLSASTVMQYMGPERMHPNPSFLYARGAGPLFDMGPYYLSALVNVLGPIDTVAAVGSRSRTERAVRVGDAAGETFPVEVDTHVLAMLRFKEGGVAESTLSFDTPFVRNGIVEVTGTEGTLVLTDPNKFAGVVRHTSEPDPGPWPPAQVWTEHAADAHDAGRGIGVLDMAREIRAGGAHRASAELGLHVLEGMLAIERSLETHAFVPVESTVARPALLPEGWDPFAATL